MSCSFRGGRRSHQVRLNFSKEIPMVCFNFDAGFLRFGQQKFIISLDYYALELCTNVVRGLSTVVWKFFPTNFPWIQNYSILRPKYNYWESPIVGSSVITHAPWGVENTGHSSFLFFFSVENVQVNWIFGITWCVFLSRANSAARCRQCFVTEFFQVYIVFLVVTSFAKTKCYSPSNLLSTPRHINYWPVENDTWRHCKHSMIILVTKPISITPVLSLAQKAS